jgi:hypothetical protein
MSLPRARQNETQAPRREAARSSDATLGSYQLEERPDAGPARQRCQPSGATRQPATADWRDTVIERHRQDWQPKVVQPDSAVRLTADAQGPEAAE